MKIKHLIFTISILTTATFITNCAKEPVKEALNQVQHQTGVADDRGPNCTFVFTTTGDASICGTAGNGVIAANCTSCGGAQLGGLALFDANNPHNYLPATVNGAGAVRNLSGAAITVTVFINNVQVAQTQIAAGGCDDFVYTPGNQFNPCGTITF